MATQKSTTGGGAAAEAGPSIPFFLQMNGSYNIDPSTNATALLEDCLCFMAAAENLLQNEADNGSGSSNVLISLYFIEMTTRAVERALEQQPKGEL